MTLAMAWRKVAETAPTSPKHRLIFGLLWPFSQLFRGALQIRRWLYAKGWISSYRSSVPVISVGNLAVGGTGKTPFSDYLCQWFHQRGFKVALVSRGYGRTSRETLRVPSHVGPDRWSEFGDEPILLARRNPEALVIVASPKRLGVQLAEQEGAEVILLDDGFQHWGVERVLDIVLLDPERPFGNGALLPAGLLREPVSALKRSDLVVLGDTSPTGKARVAQHFQGEVLTCHRRLAASGFTLEGEPYPLEALRGKTCFAFTGIAKATAFFKMLQVEKIDLLDTLALPDHVEYKEAHYENIQRLAAGADILLTTEKDGAKLDPRRLTHPCVVVPLCLSVPDEMALERSLLAAIGETK